MNNNYKLVNFCEIDEKPAMSYCAIHNVDPSLNLGDITKVDIESLPKVDLITHDSPCQDYSQAGLQKGGDKGSNTRSSLMWYSVDIIKHCNPKFIIWENVKNVLNEKHKHNFDKYISDLNEIGYNSYYKVLNCIDYTDIPQNRERIFCISIRKDIDYGFEFPNKKECKKSPIDFLENITNNKYIVNVTPKYDYTNFVTWDDNKGNKNGSYNRAWKIDKKIGCLSASNVLKIYDYNIVRKLTPLEHTLFMGFTNKDYKNMSNVVNDNSIYKQTGNSIVVDVIYLIYKQLYKKYPNDFQNLSMISLFSGIGAFEKALDKFYDYIKK